MLRGWIGFGVMLGNLFGQTPPGAQNSAPRQEFTVQLVRRFAALQPNSKDSTIPFPQYSSQSFSFATRADGAWATTYPEYRTIGLPATGQIIMISGKTRTTSAIARGSFRPVVFAAHDPVCTEAAAMGLSGKGHFDGWDEVLGIRVARYLWETKDMKSAVYYAPDLDCFRLKYTHQAKFFLGIPLIVAVEEATLVQRGQPDPGLFRDSQ